MKYEQVLRFWFEEVEPAQVWMKDKAFDQLITDKFSDVYQQAIKCELFHWRVSPEGRLAEIILLDQFSRNMFRDSGLAFKYDFLALSLSQQALLMGADKRIEKHKRGFMYLPYMHSESRIIHSEALRIYQDFGNQSSLEFEIKHKNIIDEFGRYPHRNKALGRVSTSEELVFLKGPNSGF